MHVSFERTAREAPLGTVLLAHGYAEHCGRYTHLRSALTRAGYDVARWTWEEAWPTDASAMLRELARHGIHPTGVRW